MSDDVIERGSIVQIEYTLRDESGAILDSNQGQAPLTYRHGEHEIIPGLESALDGLRVGDERQITIKPEDAYGPVDPTAVVEVPARALPPDALVPGTELVARTPDGGSRVVRVKEIREQSVLLDLNHPLAGKTLHFDVRVVGVVPPTAP